MTDQGDERPNSPGDARPRPQYGEYATPEEQKARIRQPDATFALDSGVAPAQAAPAAAPAPGSPRTGSEALHSRRRVDRIATIALLAFGAFNVVVSVGSYLDLASGLDRAMETFGIPGDFTNVESAQVWGIVAACVLVAGFLVSAAFAVGNLRRDRLAWWIPVVGAVVTYAAVTVCLSVPIFGDPAFIAYAASLSR